jgi:phage-related tail protein
MQFLTEKGDTIATFSSKKDPKGEPIKEVKEYYTEKDKTQPNTLPTKVGQNMFSWNMNYADATKIEGEGSFMWTGSVGGPQAIPGKYVVKLLLADSLLMQQPFEIVKDPRIQTTDAEFKEQLSLALKIRDKLSETHQTVNDLRKIRQQINAYMGSLEDTTVSNKLKKTTKPILDTLSRIEDKLVQHRAKAFQDLLNYPIKLNDKLAGIGNAVRSADAPPTKQSYEAYNDIVVLVDKEITSFKTILNEKIPELNKTIMEQQTPIIKLSKKK